ncbi:hypothetical protein ACS0TY_000387 [Phlomoides rotata]
MKKQVTIAQEFNCAVDKRTPPPTTVVDLFDMLSICSESHHEKPPLPRLTTRNPFHLHTDRRLAEELLQKQVEEERARVSKAHLILTQLIIQLYIQCYAFHCSQSPSHARIITFFNWKVW